MPVVNQADAENNTAACIDSLKNAQLDISRCVAFVSASASMMIGKQKGTSTLLRKERRWNYGMGCACHLFALAAKEFEKV